VWNECNICVCYLCTGNWCRVNVISVCYLCTGNWCGVNVISVCVICVQGTGVE
jgi:hypothetical protein